MKHNHDMLTSDVPAMRRVLTLAEGVAAAPTTVLLAGESGTGKEVLARAIHQASPRQGGAFVAVNCAAIPATLIEATFFGHEKGAFSGAGEKKPGTFEQADGGTLLLDEVSELPLELQAKLLRVIQERQVTRLGGTRAISFDVRIIATTNRDLSEMVARGEFRQDLYYRLNVFPIALPPLRERIADLPELCAVIIDRLSGRLGRAPLPLSPAAEAKLTRYAFPGNVRELQNLLERALILSHGEAIEADALMFDHPAELAAPSGDGEIAFDGMTLAEVERLVILSTLQRLEGNRTRTSEALGISLRTLRNRLREYRGAGFAVAQAA